MTLIHKREKICPEIGTQRTDLRSRLWRDFLGAEQKAVLFAEFAQAKKRRDSRERV